MLHSRFNIITRFILNHPAVYIGICILIGYGFFLKPSFSYILPISFIIFPLLKEYKFKALLGISILVFLAILIVLFLRRKKL